LGHGPPWRPDGLDSPEELAWALETAALAVEWAERARQRALERMLAGVPVPGWTVAPGRATRHIGDAAAAWKASGLPIGLFLGACRPSVGDLERLHSARPRTRAARDAFGRRYGGLVEERPGAARPQRTA